MSLRVVRLGTPRHPDEGTRIGTVRRPPRGVPKEEHASRDFYAVWFPNLAPSPETMKLGLAAETEKEWTAFTRKYRKEMRTPDARRGDEAMDGDFSAREILDAIAASRPDVGIVTLAPELPGGLELVRALVEAGHRVSLGHSGADFDTAVAAIETGARHATHLFNRMTPMTHRTPGLAGAVLSREDIAAELICDGYHVHPAMCRLAIAAKGVQSVMAITDGTAASGLPVGAFARLGGRRIEARAEAAFLDEGTLAGSTLTMDRAFRTLVTRFGSSIVEAATMCSTTPARELGLTGFGVIATGATADLTVLDRAFRVVRTFIAGEQVVGPAAVQ